MDTQYSVVKVYGRICLYIEYRIESIPEIILPPGHYLYDVRHADNDSKFAVGLAKKLAANRMGSIITKRPIAMLENKGQDAYLDISADPEWQLYSIGHNLCLEDFDSMTEFEAGTYGFEYPTEHIIELLDKYFDKHNTAATAGSEFAMTDTQANIDAHELIMDILDAIADKWSAKNFYPESPDEGAPPVHERDDEVIIPTDIFDVVEILGRRALLLTKPFSINPEHIQYADDNKLFYYDLYYMGTDGEQAQRVRLVEAQDCIWTLADFYENKELYYGTILTKYHIPGAGVSTADEGSIHIDIAEIVRVYADKKPIRATVQDFVDFYEGRFYVPPPHILVQLLNEHGCNNLNTVYYGAEGIKDTNESMDAATVTMCNIFDEYMSVNPDIDPASRPPLESSENAD